MTKRKNGKLVKRGRWWFNVIKRLMVKRYPCPKFVYLGRVFNNGSLILTNHEGTDAPMSLEMYLDAPIRMWGAHQMNSGLINLYKYQTKVYYHQKKHWNIHLARLFCIIASPLTNLFYKGLNLISTYRDARFFKTINESIKAIKNGTSIVVYPEDSKNGYLPQLQAFYSGFLVFANACAKKDIDIDIVVAYFKKKERIYIFDEPIKYSSLVATFDTKEGIVSYLLDRCNELGEMNNEALFTQSFSKIDIA